MINKLKILLVEHDYQDIELIQFELKKGGIDFEAEVVKNELDYINALYNFTPDIILSDYSFPSFDGQSAFKLKQNISPDTPFIFISGVIGDERSVELIKEGVTDYVLKDKMYTLTPKIRRALLEFEMVEEKRKSDELLVTSEKRLARAQQLGNMGSWVYIARDNYLLLSDEACHIYGLESQENDQSFEDWVSFIHPEDIEHCNELKEALHSATDFTINCRILRKNGSVRNIYIEGKPEFDLIGNAIGLYGIVQDVTKAILLENALVKERRMRQSLVTTAVLTAQENEHFVMAKALNENLNQVLVAAKLYIELAQTDEEKKFELLERSLECIVSVIVNIRSMSKSLLGPGRELGLFSCIKNLIADLQKVYPVKIHFHTDNIAEDSLNQTLQTNIFRIIQSQVTNIIKHSKAKKAVIRLSLQQRTVTLLIIDDGRGTKVVENTEGIGLKNIRIRAQLHDGTSSIVSFPGKGFELKVTLSVNEYSGSKLAIH